MILLYIHLLAATIWVGGHLILAISLLPEALAKRDPKMIESFERIYERIGMPALIIQVITGLWLSYRLLPDIMAWADWSDAIALTISLKLICLAATFGLALHARFRVIPRLTPASLAVLGGHIIAVTFLGLAFAWLGLSFSYGGV
ncbi:CopD family protein [Robiginitomaculum antarcticum]|uniref:CopD family protein n=1 Tax=Robiginitomaculum antarcticum TaxID=437507 RepID=UPI000381B945|nr:CopD family protein [Robiginitomaculum antarcticum]